MNVKDREFIVSAAEMEALFKLTKIKAGLLSVLPKGMLKENQEEIFVKQFETLDDSEKEKALNYLKILGNPDKVLELHYNIADFQVSRSTLAKINQIPEDYVSLGGSADPFKMGSRNEFEIRYIIREVLAANVVFDDRKSINANVSSDVALAFLAVLDQYRRGWYFSVIKNHDPLSVFSISDIKDRLKDAQIEDFRWILPMTEKVLPYPIAETELFKNPKLALEELATIGLIEKMDDNVGVYEFTKEGLALAELNRTAISRMVISSTYKATEDQLAADVYFLIRAHAGLFLVLISGEQAAISSLSLPELDFLLDLIFKPIEFWSSEDENRVKDMVEDTIKPPPLSKTPPPIKKSGPPPLRK